MDGSGLKKRNGGTGSIGVMKSINYQLMILGLRKEMGHGKQHTIN